MALSAKHVPISVDLPTARSRQLLELRRRAMELRGRAHREPDIDRALSLFRAAWAFDRARAALERD
jgi:hypothetical protein